MGDNQGIAIAEVKGSQYRIRADRRVERKRRRSQLDLILAADKISNGILSVFGSNNKRIYTRAAS